MRAKDLQRNSNQKSHQSDGTSLWFINQLLVFFCLLGLGLSLYAFSVEMAMEGNKNYRPYCDINPYVSCTKAFGSPYGKGFGIFGKDSVFHKQNSFFGIVFYSMVATLSFFNTPVAINASLLLIILSNFASLYFAYILVFVIKDLCVVCIGTYIVNLVNFLLITQKHRRAKLINASGGEQVNSMKKTD